MTVIYVVSCLSHESFCVQYGSARVCDTQGYHTSFFFPDPKVSVWTGFVNCRNVQVFDYFLLLKAFAYFNCIENVGNVFLALF